MKKIYLWQQKQWQLITKRLHDASLPHAILLTGSAGMGKLDFANTLAELLLCFSASGETCQTCSACQLLKAGTHPDFLLIQPESKGKTIKVDQIRELIEKLSQTPQQGKNQVVIIEPAEAMNTAAANALLKTLEEPTGNIFLILVSHQPTRLPATIRSRCQQIIFKITDKEIIKNWLQQQLPTVQNIDLLLSLTEYAPLTTLQLAQDNTLAQQEKFSVNLAALVAGKIDPIKLAVIANEIEIKEVLKLLLTLLNDTNKIKLGIKTDLISHQNKLELLNILAQKFSSQKIANLQEKTIELTGLLQQNANLNGQLLLEDLFINFTTQP